MSTKIDTCWAKVLLSSYRYIGRVCGAIDKLVLRQGLASGCWTGKEDTMQVCEDIIVLSERKVALINTKVLIEDCLKSIDLTYAKLLIVKFIDGDKIEDIASNFGFAVRTTFRKIETSLQKFESALCSKGYTDEKLNDMLKNEAWIKRLHTSIGKEDNFNMLEPSIKKAAQNKEIKGEEYEK